MHVQVLSSGSRGNSTLVRAGETHILADAGLSLRELERRLAEASVATTRIDHIALTHGHLDHARSAGALGRKARARVHCAMRMMQNASVRKAPTLAALPIGGTTELAAEGGRDPVLLRTVPIPHDAEPTVALRFEFAGRVLVQVTDMGHPEPRVTDALSGAHVLVLEFNHDSELLRRGPYTPALKRRVAGPGGHLSNDEAATLLRRIAGPELHTLVLAHLSEQNNTPELALRAARHVLADVGLTDVAVIVAEQDRIGPNLAV